MNKKTHDRSAVGSCRNRVRLATRANGVAGYDDHSQDHLPRCCIHLRPIYRPAPARVKRGFCDGSESGACGAPGPAFGRCQRGIIRHLRRRGKPSAAASAGEAGGGGAGLTAPRTRALVWPWTRSKTTRGGSARNRRALSASHVCNNQRTRRRRARWNPPVRAPQPTHSMKRRTYLRNTAWLLALGFACALGLSACKSSGEHPTGSEHPTEHPAKNK